MNIFNKKEHKTGKKGFVASFSNDTLQIDIFSSIDEWWGYGVSSLTNQLAEAKGKPLLVRVNSFGGDVTQGYAISNLLKGYNGDVTIQIVGYACSIASVFSTVQNKVQMAKDAFFMIHNPSANWVSGTVKEIESSLDALKMFEDKIVASYVEAITRRGKFDENTESRVRSAMNKETWYTAEQALSEGFIDEIIEGADTLQNVLSERIYDNYFYNNVTDFQNMPDELKEKFENTNEKKEKMTKKKFFDFFGISDEVDTPENTPENTKEELTVESAIKLLESNNYVVTTADDVLTEAEISAQFEKKFAEKLATEKTKWEADLKKGSFVAPKAEKKEPENVVNKSSFADEFQNLKFN